MTKPRTPIAALPPALALGLILALAGCGKADNDPGPGGVTVGEARALDEAAQMLDSRRPPADLLAPSSTQQPGGEASETAAR